MRRTGKNLLISIAIFIIAFSAQASERTVNVNASIDQTEVGLLDVFRLTIIR